MTRFSISGYSRFYKSLPRFCRDITEKDAAELTYLLYTANLESYRHKRPDIVIDELRMTAFYNRLIESKQKSYRTIIQLYRAMEALSLSIDTKCVEVGQAKAYLDIWFIMDDIEDRFIRNYDMEIYDKRTIYRLCKRGLVPYKNEPGLCLLEDLNIPVT